MGILNEPDISKISERDLLADLARPNLSMEPKSAVIQELTRRQTIEVKGAIADLKKAIDKFDKSTSYYSKAVSVLTVFLVVIAIEQLLASIFPPKGAWVLVYVVPDVALLAMSLWLANKVLDKK